MDLIKQISESIHFFVRDNFPDGTILFTQIALKSIFFVLVIFLVDFVIRKIVGWVLKYISNKYDIFDWESFNDKAKKYEVVATDVITGESKFFDKNNCSDIISAVKASASMPVMSKMIDVEGRKYLDGGISTSIAYKREFDVGYSKAIVVIKREEGYRKKNVNKINESIYKRYFKKMKNMVEKLMNVYER